MIERCHKTLHNMIRSVQIKDKWDLDSFLGFKGVLAACRKAMNSTVHTTARAMPTQLVFSCGAMLSASFQADWQFIKERKQRLIIQNNKRENAADSTCAQSRRRGSSQSWRKAQAWLQSILGSYEDHSSK